MNNVTQFQSKATIREQASLWVSRIDRGLSETEKALLSEWLKNEHHRDALFFMAALWDDMSVLDQLSELFPLNKQKKPTTTPKRKHWLIAASVVMMSLLTGVMLTSPSYLPAWFPGAIEVNQYQTAIGQQQRFSMSDGSVIQLNTNSQIDVTYTNEQRRIHLIKGEAQFDVAKDAERPFTVTVGSKSFTALGTIFNLRKNEENDVELLVTEGKVLMAAANIPLNKVLKNFEAVNATDGQALNLSAEELVVHSGEKAAIHNNITTPAQPLSLDQVQKSLAWQQGMLIFDGDNLDSALKDISRYTTKVFSLADPSLANIKVSGYFKAGDIEGLIQSLQTNFNIKTQYRSPQHIVLHSDKSSRYLPQY